MHPIKRIIIIKKREGNATSSQNKRAVLADKMRNITQHHLSVNSMEVWRRSCTPEKAEYYSDIERNKHSTTLSTSCRLSSTAGTTKWSGKNNEQTKPHNVLKYIEATSVEMNLRQQVLDALAICPSQMNCDTACGSQVPGVITHTCITTWIHYWLCCAECRRTY